MFLVLVAPQWSKEWADSIACLDTPAYLDYCDRNPDHKGMAQKFFYVKTRKEVREIISENREGRAWSQEWTNWSKKDWREHYERQVAMGKMCVSTWFDA